MLNDYLDNFVLKNERDEAVEIIRKCKSILAGSTAGPNDKELMKRLLEVLDSPAASAITRQNSVFVCQVS